ncbi:hypothetical protein H5410_045171 [Solanum commersonii]|uniref:Uncharacterized protein n=1 Tax=Solanum commersonii TaxID=4109 RepID=A0A9J5X8T4_SOLCO|nr:hypothetical protein H5410_045171 [Solanum commersonii]
MMAFLLHELEKVITERTNINTNVAHMMKMFIMFLTMIPKDDTSKSEEYLLIFAHSFDPTALDAFPFVHALETSRKNRWGYSGSASVRKSSNLAISRTTIKTYSSDVVLLQSPSLVFLSMRPGMNGDIKNEELTSFGRQNGFSMEIMQISLSAFMIFWMIDSWR